ncbi:MAG: DUF3079 domain-containing protein [Rhodocyclaceae bacterium]
MAKRFPLHPKHPERICWGCDRYCSTDNLQCGNGSGRTQHPAELLGDDWYLHGDWGLVDGPDPSASEEEAGTPTPHGSGDQPPE